MNELIEKILNQAATPLDIRQLNQWIGASQANRERWETALSLHEGRLLSVGATEFDDHYAGLEKIRQRFQQRRKKKWRMRLIGVSIVATIAVVFLVIIYPKSKPANFNFSSRSLAEIAVLLEKEFDVKIELSHGGVGTCRFTGSFHHISSAEEVTGSIASALDLTFRKIDAQTIELSGKGCLN